MTFSDSRDNISGLVKAGQIMMKYSDSLRSMQRIWRCNKYCMAVGAELPVLVDMKKIIIIYLKLV